MPTIVLFTPVQPNGVNPVDYTQVIVQVDARVVSAARARHTANGWLLWNVGERIAVGDPELILNEKLTWRFPLRWTSTKQGRLADLAAELRIDAVSGEVLATQSTVEEILNRVQSAARAVQAPAS